MSNAEFDSEEQEFRRDLDPPAGVCPKADLLMAARSGIAFEGAEDVARHLAVCPFCRQLSIDLAQYEVPGVSEAEDRRIRARWQTARRGRLRLWRWAAAAAAVAVIVTGAVFLRSMRYSAPAPAPAVPQRVSPFTLAKAPIKIPATAILTYRGAGDDNKEYLTELAAALEPYGKDDYAEAAGRLERLVQKYPDRADPAFYLGVCRLLLNRNEAAIESLRAARLRGGVLSDDISWYLAAAYDRAGRSAEARREAARLCRGTSEYKAGACYAVNQPAAR